VVDREKVEVGPFGIEFLAVNHSIPDAMAVAITTPAGRVLHTGDFKVDQLPLDGRVTDLNSFARLGDEGIDILMVDSTNAEVPGFIPSETDIMPVLDSVFAKARGRVIVASFASHVHRIQQIIDMAVEHKRKIAFVGRSMVRNMTIARDLGYLRIPEGTLVSSDDLADLPDDRAVLICTGSQGEPMAVLSRIANRDHAISVGPSDTVVLASSLIPGNETAVNRVINGLTRLEPTSSIREMRWCTSPATPRRGSCVSSTTSPSPGTCCRCTGNGGTCWPTRGWPRASASRISGSC